MDNCGFTICDQIFFIRRIVRTFSRQVYGIQDCCRCWLVFTFINNCQLIIKFSLDDATMRSKMLVMLRYLVMRFLE